MAHLIDKSALVAEIERICAEEKALFDEDCRMGFEPSPSPAVVCTKMECLLSFINTLEVKEVDINKEISQFIDANFENATIGHKLSLRRVAKHFFELGLSVNNPITASDRGTAEEIIINLKRVEQDYRINLTKEIEWVRNQIKKGK